MKFEGPRMKPGWHRALVYLMSFMLIVMLLLTYAYTKGHERGFEESYQLTSESWQGSAVHRGFGRWVETIYGEKEFVWVGDGE